MKSDKYRNKNHRSLVFTLIAASLLILAIAFIRCGGGGGGGTPSGSGNITITTPDTTGMVYLVGTLNAVSGAGIVTATNITESSSSISGKALIPGCTTLTGTGTSYDDGSFSSIGICGDINDQVKITYTNSGGTTTNVATLTVPSDPHASCSEADQRLMTIKNTSSQDIWLGITAGTMSCLTDADCPTGAAGSCVGSNPGAGTAGTCGCSSDAECGDIGQCNTSNSFCYFNLPELGKSQLSLAKTTGHTTICFPAPATGKNIQWSGNMFARTGCDANGQNCQTGDCSASSSGVCPVGTGGNPPATLFEFTLSNQTGTEATEGDDFYDVSIINGTNLAVAVGPVAGTFEADAGDPYSCQTPGSMTASGSLEACTWEFSPTVETIDRTTLLRDVHPTTITGTCPDGSSSPNSLGYCACTADSDCSSASLLCGNALNASSGNKYTQVCGTFIGWWTADQICGSTIGTSSPYGAPLNCAATVANSDGSTSTNTNFHICTKPADATNPEQSQSCYNSAAVEDCCGCATSASSSLSGDWPTALSPNFGGSDNGCYSNNPRWVTIAQPWLVFLKQACPTAYTYPFDDATSTFTCHKGTSTSIPSYAMTFSDTQ